MPKKPSALRWSRWQRFRDSGPDYQQSVLMDGSRSVLTVYTLGEGWRVSFSEGGDDARVTLRSKDREAARVEAWRLLRLRAERGIRNRRALLDKMDACALENVERRFVVKQTRRGMV